MTAALRLIGDHGYHGATTRAIAAEAGVSEVTLFRRFGSKRDLMAAALAHVTEDFRAAGTEPTDDVAADLERLGAAYQTFVGQWPGLVARLLAEAAVGSDIGALVSVLIVDNAKAAATVVAHHQAAGRLAGGPPEAVVSAFLGPILLGATLGRLLTDGSLGGSATPVDITDHTRGFLDGYRP